MAENEPEKESREEITPRQGTIELHQVFSVLLIPVSFWLWLAGEDALAGLVFALVVVLFVRPFFLIKAEVEEAEAEKRRIEEKARLEGEKVKAAEKAAAEVALLGTDRMKPALGTAVAPYHSRHKDAEVYHIFADCNVGEDIEPENWTEGDDDRPLCKVCEEMTRGREKQKPAA